MAHHNKVFPAGATDGVTNLTAAELVALDLGQYTAVDGDAGGTWSPAAAIVLGGQGVQLNKLALQANVVALTGGSPTYTVDNGGNDVAVLANISSGVQATVNLPIVTLGRVVVVADFSNTIGVGSPASTLALAPHNTADTIDGAAASSGGVPTLSMLAAGGSIVLLGVVADSGAGGAWKIIAKKSGRVTKLVTTVGANANVWTAPPGCTWVDLELFGGGGSGAGGTTGDNTTTNRKGGGPGGGGAPLVRSRVPVTPGQAYDAPVGGGGASVAAGTAGNDGGSSRFLPHGGLNLAFAPGGGGAPAAVAPTGGTSYAPGGTISLASEIVIGSSAASTYAIASEGQGGFGATGDAADAANVQSTWGATMREASTVSGGGSNGGSPGTSGTHDGTGPYYGGGSGAGGGGGPGGAGGSGGNGGAGNHSGAGGAGGAGTAAAANTGAGGGGGGAGGSGTSGGVGGVSGAGGSGQVAITYDSP